VDNLPAGDLSDIAVFPDLSPHLFLVSEGTAVVMEVDLNGPTPELFSVFSLKPWPIPRANGLTTNQLGQIVIVGKHAANTPEDDFNVFIPVDGPSPSGNLPILPSGSPPISINWIHPGGAQQAEFFINLNETGSGEIFIYDQNGREVHSFRTPEFPPGQYRAPWDLINDQGTHVASGVYFVLIKTPDSMRKEKLVIVR
jgi:hypothetical protein